MSNTILELRQEVGELIDHYIATIDDDQLEEWVEMFTDDGCYEMVPLENERLSLPAPLVKFEGKGMLRDRVVSLREANIYEYPAYRHIVSGLVVSLLKDGRIAARANYLVTNTSLEGETRLYQTGVYYDVIARTDNGLKFAEKRVIYDTGRVQTLLAYPI